MNKKLLLIISVLMVFTMIFTACQKADTKTPSEEDTIKIGWIGGLTGDFAPWGTCESNAANLIAEQTNANGGILGKKVEIISYDTRGDATESVNAVKRLITQDKVIAILGPNTSGPAMSIASVLNEHKVPDIATVATNPKVTVQDDGTVNPYNFRICFIDPYQGAVAAGYAVDRLGYTKGAVLYDVSSDASEAFSQYFQETFIEKGGEIVAVEGFKGGDVDFRPQLSKIKEANPEVILFPYNYKDVALSANQARELGITATLMGGDGWPSEVLMEMAGDAVEGSFIVNHLDIADPIVKEFTDQYVEKYNIKPEINAYLVHDAFKLLEAAIIDANSFDTVKITESLTKVSVEGLTGTIKLSEEDHNPIGKQAAIQEIVNKEYVFKERYSPY
ncbi:MAG TPA: ABC transporter substrate-binding protein [Clostridiales bacterium]|jgi:branched-chain amino acid transport system substrate-binding protein|nr:ABC transporter substrate-binding protein [Clostridiales bacterium]